MRDAASEAGPAGGAAPLAIVLLLGLLWGFNWPAVRVALFEIAPWTLRAGGMLAAGLLLVAIALAMGRSLAVPRAHWLRLAVTGVLTIAAFNVLLAFAQLVAPTSRIAIVTFTMPIWAVIFARIVLGERFDRPRVLGLSLGITGLVALGWPMVEARAVSVGILYALLAGASWAAGTVVAKRFPTDAPPLTIAAWQLLIGAACAGVGMAAFEGLPAPAMPSQGTVVAFAYHVILAQALAYYLWFEIVPRTAAGIATLGTLTVPAVGVFGAALILGERPAVTDYLGLVLVVAAAAAIRLPPRVRAR